MASLFMVITDQSGAVLAGESTSSVYNPFTKTTVTKPVSVVSLGGETEQTFTFSSQTTGTGAGKVAFDPFFVTKVVDSVSQALFLAQCTGAALKYVDLLVVAGGATTTPLKPYLSYRLGLVGVSDIQTASGDDRATETVKFEFGTLQVGYQGIKADGTLGTFAPVGWDRTKNIKI